MTPPAGGLDRDRHRLERPAGQRLGGQDVLDLAGADAERQRTERAVGRCGVAADDCHAGLGQPELRADDVHDALVGVPERMQAHAELLAVAAQGLDLRAGHGSAIGLSMSVVGTLWSSVASVRSGRRTGGRPAQAVEGLRAGDLVDQVEVDVEQVRLALGRRTTCASQTFSFVSPKACSPSNSIWGLASQHADGHVVTSMDNSSGVGVLDKAALVLGAWRPARPCAAW